MPEILQNSYQNYTCAVMDKLQEAGYPMNFLSLDDSVLDYVVNYLSREFSLPVALCHENSDNLITPIDDLLRLEL